MRDIWYGDQRDLVKWGALVHLARTHRKHLIVQVLLLRPGQRPHLLHDGVSLEIPEEVWSHFRTLDSVRSLGVKVGIDIELFDRAFEHPARVEYFDSLCAFLRNRAGRSKVVLLDPDTGIEPGNAGAAHVAVSEIREVWEALSPGDWLVVYQHLQRTGSWLEDNREKFVSACGVDSVLTFQGTRARDVAFFAASRP